MRLSRPREGFVLAWRGDLGQADEDEPTRRRWQPVLDALEAFESAPSCPSVRGEYAPVTPELLRKIRAGLDAL